ncbi:MAG: site-specific integrase [Clostridia bacterium]|nr:site-specific integrase [Clostridia bacterium]
MSVHITKNKKGLYDVRVFSTHKDEFGKRKSKFKANVKNLTTAKLLADEFQDKLDSFINDDLTFSELHQLYEKSRSGKMSITTTQNNKYLTVPILDYFGAVKIDKINNRLVQQYIDLRQKTKAKNKDEHLKKSTIKREYSYIRAVLNWAVANDFLQHNRVIRVEFNEDDEDFEPTLLNANMVSNVLTKLKQYYYNLYIPVLLCSMTGLRRGEALGLKWENIDFEKNTITINKSVVQVKGKVFEKNSLKTKSSKRVLFIPRMLKTELLEHKKMNAELQSDFVCANIFMGEILKPSNLTHKFHDFMKSEFGIEIRLHDLRHSLNQMMFECGIDTTTRAQVLGHSNTKTTDTIYTHNSLPLIADALCCVDSIVNKKL